MRGMLANPMSGFTSNQFNHSIPELQNCHVQEMGYWMWRVRAIRFAISMTISPPPDEENTDEPDSIAFDGVFGCPINGINGPWKNEAQQVVHRTGFRNSPNGMISDPYPDNPIKGWAANFGEGFPHNPLMPGETGWAMTASLRVTFSTGVFDTERGSSVEQSGMYLSILGADPILGGVYFHQVPLWTRALTEDWTVSGNAIIEPILFYEWKDELGHPLFRQTNGHYV